MKPSRPMNSRFRLSRQGANLSLCLSSSPSPSTERESYAGSVVMKEATWVQCPGLFSVPFAVDGKG